MSRPGVVQRSDSYAAPMQSTLKRAPSFGATSIASGAGVSVAKAKQVAAAEKQPQDPESDEEEKVREKKVKRPRTRSTHASGPSSDKKREKKTQASKDAVSKTSKPTGKPSTTKSATGKARPQVRVRSGSMFGPELPMPQPVASLPSASSKPVSGSSSAASPKPQSQPVRRGTASPPPSAPAGEGTKTLRRVKTTAFNLGSCPTARRISFGSLEVPAEERARGGKGGEGGKAGEGKKKETGSTLGSAIQLS